LQYALINKKQEEKPMLKRSKKTVCILMSLALVMTLFAGCNGKKTTGEKGLVDIHMIAQINPEVTLTNNPVVALIKKDLGINLIIEAPPQNGFSDRVKVEVAAGDMPDMFISGTDIAATNWAKEGLFANLTNLIKNYPNLERNISAQQWGDTKLLDDNNIWGVPRPNSYDKWGFMINKAWLTKLGLTAPKTVDEFNAVCKAFTTQDPDGNGKADTYGAAFDAQQSSVDSGVWHMHNDFLATAYNISDWNHQMPDKNGSFTLRPYKSEYYDYLTELRNLYSQNIIDRDFVTFNSNEDLDAFAEGRVGIVGASEKAFVGDIITKYNLDPANYEFCPPLTLDSSSKPTYVLSPSNWMAFYINAKSKHIADCLRLLDWGNSQAGFVATQLGIQGTDYNSYDVANRQVNRTTAQQALATTVTSNMFSFANALDGLPCLEGGSTPALTTYWKQQSSAAESVVQNMYVPFTKFIDSMNASIPDQAKQLNTLEVRYVTGQGTESDLQSYVNGAYKTATSSYDSQLKTYMAKNPATIK
jgi:hypothetical protein